jgi:cysteinyl-tRNA synthetase
MTFRIFNTLARKKEAFRAENSVHLYTCGPTVYDYAHIGNMRAYLFYDLLRRWMECIGYDVKHVMNITDVDDKTIKGARLAGASLKEFTGKYTGAFFEDIEKLRIKRASVYPRATEHINDMVELIKILLLRGFAYRSDDGSIYFSVGKFRKYGRLSKLRMKKLKAGARVSQDEYTKEQAQDFALWKAWQDSDGDVFWQTAVGKGRPGWHIECSAMSKKYLNRIDIHGGGVDLIFPHHENEIAQSEAAWDKKFASYWVHCQHLLVNGKKMSKSLNNFFTLRDLIGKGHEPVAFRYLCLSAHYRSQLNFTFESLAKARAAVEKFNEFYSKIKWMKDKKETQTDGIKPNSRMRLFISEAQKKFEGAMNDDLNTPRALAAVFDFIRKSNREIDSGRADARSLRYAFMFLEKANAVLDIVEAQKGDISEDDRRLINKREELRKHKKFDEADRIRHALYARGIVLEDTPHGVRWKRVNKG